MREEYRPIRTGCVIDEAVIVLDRTASRYFLVPGGAQGPSPAPPPHDHQSVLLSWEGDRPPRRDTARQQWITSARTESPAPTRRAGAFSLWRLRCSERRCAAILRRGGLDAGLRWLEDCPKGEVRPSAIDAAVAASFASLRLWSSHDRCLPRSLALARAIRIAGGEARLVLGVTLHPFAAHAWVQDGDTVLNDMLDHVLLFRPILVA